MIVTHPNADRSSTASARMLRYARQRAGLSLTAAAERASVSRSALSAYESGVRLPPLEKLLGILEALEFSVYIELEPRVRERNGVPRGEELAQVIRLAEQYPRRDRPEISFLSILRGAAARQAAAKNSNSESA